MPSDKYVFLTPADEVALSEVLREKFPLIRFYTREANEPAFRYHADISAASAANDFEVDMVVASSDWEPAFELREEGTMHEYYAVTNYPDEAMFLRHSKFFSNEKEQILYGGSFQVGLTLRMSKAQLSFANKVWRSLPKIGTYRLLARNIDSDWREHWGKHWFAGNDAIRWAREDKSRYFHYAGFFRPYDTDS